VRASSESLDYVQKAKSCSPVFKFVMNINMNININMALRIGREEHEAPIELHFNITVLNFRD
jgi:hypothetical protein